MDTKVEATMKDAVQDRYEKLQAAYEESRRLNRRYMRENERLKHLVVRMAGAISHAANSVPTNEPLYEDLEDVFSDVPQWAMEIYNQITDAPVLTD